MEQQLAAVKAEHAEVVAGNNDRIVELETELNDLEDAEALEKAKQEAQAELDEKLETLRYAADG